MSLKLDVLNTPIVKETYDVQVNNRFGALKLLDKNRPRNKLFKVFKGTILTTVGEMLGKAPQKTRTPWISDTTVTLIDRRRAHKSLCNSFDEDEERYREAQRVIQRGA